MKKKQSAMSQREETPWYLRERPRLLASLLFAKGENVRVDDVSSLDLGLDLVVRPSKETEDERDDWMFGVVTKGGMSFPEETEVAENGILLPRSEIANVRFPEVDYPVLFAYCTMVDDATYVGITYVSLSADPDAFPTKSGSEFLKKAPPVGYVDRTDQPVPLTEVKKSDRGRVLRFMRALAHNAATGEAAETRHRKPREVATSLFSSRQ